MRAKAPYLVVLLWAAHHTTADSLPWYKARVSNAKLEGNITGTREVRSNLQCAMIARQDPEAHLFCTPTPGTCTTHGLKVLGGYNDSTSGPKTDCWTRYKCDVEGEHHLGDTCSDISVCQQGLLQPYQGSLAPDLKFSVLLAKNCVYLEKITKMNWTMARENCKTQGGDLFVAGDFHGAGQYIFDNIGESAWIGMKNQAWLDGRPVTDKEWMLKIPSDIFSNCGTFVYNSYFEGILDLSCTDPKYALCQLGMYFP